MRDNRHADPIIEHDVWVGQFAVLGRGITLGTGSVVGANAVVTKSVPPYAIVGGNPAKVIRLRFSERMVERLLASRAGGTMTSRTSAFSFEYPEVFLDQLDEALSRGAIKPFNPETVTAEDIQRLGGAA